MIVFGLLNTSLSAGLSGISWFYTHYLQILLGDLIQFTSSMPGEWLEDISVLYFPVEARASVLG